jgi:hypothetical protein
VADIITHIITPAANYDLLGLDELKLMLGISNTDTTQDAQLSQMITRYSDVVSVKCNRIFAYEELSETWSGLNQACNRIFLSHWPVDAVDIESVESPLGTVLDPSQYELEELSGKLEFNNSTTSTSGSYGAMCSPSQPLKVTYKGGFHLPDDPRPSLQALKQATEIMIWEQRLFNSIMTMGGVRSVGHKEARVNFFDPFQMLGKLWGGGPPSANAVDALLMHYVRLQV